MATTRTISTLAGAAAALFTLAAAPALRDELPAAAPHQEQQLHHAYEEEGHAAAEARLQEPDALEAAFGRESYRPGTTARLRIWTPARDVSVRVFRVGPERRRTKNNKTMEGVPVGRALRLASLRPGAVVRVPVGDWRSGLYFARLNARGRVGFAPFVVRPRRLGENRVAIVLPTRTWQTYNFRDDDGDGDGDTWYATRGHLQARLFRPYLHRGVPPHFRQYDLRFLRWLHQSGKRVDVLSQTELDGVSARALRRAYELLVFPGHHEYVTTDEYDAVEGFRNLGGNLVFLSANNFFWRIDVKNGVMTRVAKWRDLGRPEAALLGVQYIGNDDGEHRGPWLVTPAAARSWIFAGVKLFNGDEFSNAGIEIDAVAPSSPRQTRILATIPNLLGPGMTAHMTYYELPNGAKVFSAGAFTLAGSIGQPTVDRLVENLWKRLARRPTRPGTRKLAARRSGYGWPLKPFHVQHPVRGFFGDPRIGETTDGHVESKTFHFGIDISAPDGTAVYATTSGRIVWEPERPEVVAVRRDDGRVHAYWHIVPAVQNGDRAVAYTTVLGHIAKGWGHVHFAESVDGRYLNPLRSGGMGPFHDTTAPVVTSLRAERGPTGIALGRLTDSIDLVAEAFDRTPLAVPAPWTNRPVTPAALRWRVRGGAWQRPVDFRRALPRAQAFDVVYAPWTRQNKPWRNGRYRFYLARGWDTRSLPNGAHAIEIEASDTRGNVTVETFALQVANG
jgi:murein DD-endopeptidase MepM/ murein hydrolase activator NlpD